MRLGAFAREKKRGKKQGARGEKQENYLRQAGKKREGVSSIKTLEKQDARNKKQETRNKKQETKERLDFFAAWRLCERIRRGGLAMLRGRLQSCFPILEP